MASCNRMIELGAKSGFRLSKFRGINAGFTINTLGRSANFYSSSSSNLSDYQLDYRQISPNENSSEYRLDYRQISPNEKRVYPVDTHALIRSLEAQGFPSKHAEALTSAATLILNVSSEYTSQNFTSKAEMQKIAMAHEANLMKFKSDVQANLVNFKSELESSQNQHFLSLQREVDKLRNDVEKLRAEIKYEIEKVTAGQRLDLNLEKRHMRDELSNMSARITNYENRLSAEIEKVYERFEKEQHASRAHVETSKNDMMKYLIGLFVSASAVCVGLFRFAGFATKQ